MRFDKLIKTIEKECNLGICEMDEHIFGLRLYDSQKEWRSIVWQRENLFR